MTTLDDIADRMRPNLAALQPLNARVAFAFTDGGALRVDATASPVALSRDEGEADCTIRLSRDDMGRLLDGELEPAWAYATGRLKVEGSMGLAMKLAGLLER